MRGYLPWIAAALVVIADRITKSILLARIEPGGWVEVMPGFTVSSPGAVPPSSANDAIVTTRNAAVGSSLVCS